MAMLLGTNHIATTAFIGNIRIPPGEFFPAKSIRLTSVPFETTTRRSYRRVNHARAEAAETMTTTTTEEKLGIKIIRNPPETKLADLGVRSWSKCPTNSMSTESEMLLTQ